jgi:hypothetical protein
MYEQTKDADEEDIIILDMCYLQIMLTTAVGNGKITVLLDKPLLGFCQTE